tara:strand:- start:42 stop:569 length:528 start_codon:yes stop_codon:yes gene_type:complete
MAEFWGSQISNRNFLSPVGFKFSITRIPKADFFANQANIPGIDLGFAVQPTYLKDLPLSGDKLTYSDFNLRFLIDENMENYLEVHKWLRGLGYPDNVGEFGEMQTNDPSGEGLITSDATLLIYNSSFNVNTKIHFKDVFPVSLSPVEFDATMTDVDYVTAEVVFKYSIYDIEVIN